KELHSKAKGVLRDARARFNGSTSLTQHARDAVDQADSYVRDKPLQGVGIGAAVGIVLGVLLARR
ncbi:DUF883 family protein, partial [Klebsiella pneumoniae]|uniref:DUF883 family protein n=1 Tax=Klebsiella pneumoniae TaxID=573 RepID=UPI000E2F647C